MNDYEKIIDNIASRVPQPEKEDYIGKDGLIYCHKCQTPKQCKIELLGKEKIVPCICKCQKEKLEAEEKEFKIRQFQAKVKELRKVGIPDTYMQSWTFENDNMNNPQITNAMQNYVNNFTEMKKQGKGLLLYGENGRGKTYAACEVANALLDKGCSVLVTNFEKIENTVNGMFEGKQDYYDSLNRFSLLVIDDLGAERKSEYKQEIVFNVIDTRYRINKPLIVTTNLTIDELKNPNDLTAKRIYDRVLEMCFPIEVKGGNNRRQKIKDGYLDMKKMLGL